MNKNIFKGKWEELQGTVQKTWGKLTNDDLTRIKGSIKELSGSYKNIMDMIKKQRIRKLKNL